MGYRSGEIIGQHFSRFYSNEDVKSGRPEMELKVAAEKGRSEDEGWRIKKDGSRFWANEGITILEDKKRTVPGLGKMLRDFAPRKRAGEKGGPAERGIIESFTT